MARKNPAGSAPASAARDAERTGRQHGATPEGPGPAPRGGGIASAAAPMPQHEAAPAADMARERADAAKGAADAADLELRGARSQSALPAPELTPRPGGTPIAAGSEAQASKNAAGPMGREGGTQHQDLQRSSAAEPPLHTPPTGLESSRKNMGAEFRAAAEKEEGVGGRQAGEGEGATGLGGDLLDAYLARMMKRKQGKKQEHPERKPGAPGALGPSRGGAGMSKNKQHSDSSPNLAPQDNPRGTAGRKGTGAGAGTEAGRAGGGADNSTAAGNPSNSTARKASGIGEVPSRGLMYASEGEQQRSRRSAAKQGEGGAGGGFLAALMGANGAQGKQPGLRSRRHEGVGGGNGEEEEDEAGDEEDGAEGDPEEYDSSDTGSTASSDYEEEDDEDDEEEQARKAAYEQEALLHAELRRAAAAAEAAATERSAVDAAAQALLEREDILKRLEAEKEALLKASAQQAARNAAELASFSSSTAAMLESLTAEQRQHVAWRRAVAEEEAAMEGENADRARQLATAQHALDEQLLLVAAAKTRKEEAERQLRAAKEGADQARQHKEDTAKRRTAGSDAGDHSEASTSGGLEWGGGTEGTGEGSQQLWQKGRADDIARVKLKMRQLELRLAALAREAEVGPTVEEQELERSLQQLTDHLLQKQSQVETLLGEKASLALRMETEAAGLRNDKAAAASHSAVWAQARGAEGGRLDWLGAEDEETGLSRTYVLNKSRNFVLAQRDHGLGEMGNRVVYRIGEAMLGLDTFLMGSANIIRTNSAARMLLWLYCIVLHSWVAFVWLMHAHLLPAL